MLDNIKKYLNEEQDIKAVEKLLPKVEGLLTIGESIEYIAVQKKPAVNLSPDCIALTNKRIIFCRPKNFGLSMEFQDFQWKDIKDCHIKEGILGSEFIATTVGNQIITLDYLPKAQARRLYQFGQNKEEEMVEYRRQRDLENRRATAGGGIVVNTAAVPHSEAKEDPFAVLEKLKKLLQNELITEEEFNRKKAEVLSKI